MCGICGHLNIKRQEVDRDSILGMTATITHRGPDNQDVFVEDNIGLGHTRLSILDLSSNGHQPMKSGDGRYIIVFNGEIYNYIELKEKLLSKGAEFKTKTDTEVLLWGYRFWGTSFFEELNGIFAFAIWDREEKRLTVARDRFGVKPLYFTKTSTGFYFGSEIKTILSFKNVSRKISLQGLHEFLYYGNPLEDRTMFEEIHKVPPGFYVTLQGDNFEKKAFWLHEKITDLKHPVETEVIANVREKLDKAVSRQLISDVPVGVFLSGGIDSSCITAFATKHYQGKINTYSVGFDFDMGINELPKAKKIAAYYNTNHHEINIKGADIGKIVEDLVWHHDEPFSDAANIPLYILTKQLNGSPKVILQGDGGDEIFAGYRRYNILDNLRKWRVVVPALAVLNNLTWPKVRREQFKRMLNAVGQKDDAMLMALLLTTETNYEPPVRILSEPLRQKLATTDPFAYYKELNKRFEHLDIVQRMLFVDSKIILPATFLEKVDKSTMANGIEVRVPFLDNELTEYVMSLPSEMKVKYNQKKYILRKALRGIVPDEVLDAPKTGFGVPFSNWLKGPLKQMLIDKVNSKAIKELNIFDEQVLNRCIEEHVTGLRNHGFLLWKMLNLSIWLEKYNAEI